jgi:hypothetical protein
MTINQLKEAVNPKNGVVRIRHNLNKTVSYWPLGMDENEDHVALNGYWIADQTEGIIVMEVIKVKKTDLPQWNVVES